MPRSSSGAGEGDSNEAGSEVSGEPSNGFEGREFQGRIIVDIPKYEFYKIVIGRSNCISNNADSA